LLSVDSLLIHRGPQGRGGTIRCGRGCKGNRFLP
jgi:hypothetical protein